VASPSVDTVTDVILETFKLNGALLAAGDALVADIHLTSARWQVIGAIALEGRPLTVSQAARRMGLSRQAVQRVMNDLEGVGLVELLPNPDHKRAPLAALTEAGLKAYAQAQDRQRAWALKLADGLKEAELKTALACLQHLYARCSDDQAIAQEA